MNVIVRNIPNTITCINLIAGVMAIIFLTGEPNPAQSWQPWMSAAICIAVAAVADFCDGLAARALKAYSNLGKELDSLCDLVSFGVAPAVMVYKCFAADPVTAPISYLAILIAVCGALRLARFNIDDRQTTSFIGLPIPANALFWIGLTAMFCINPAMLGRIPAAIVIVVESLLMVLPVPLVSLKFKNLRWRGNARRWLTIVAAVVCVSTMGVPGLMWTIVAYVLISQMPVK